MVDFYDFIVIGAGISACTFASTLNRRFSNASILLVECGRRIGGRSTTRKSRKNINLQFDHGLPSINLSINISNDLFNLITPLIKSKKLLDISKDILLMNEFGEINHLYIHDKIYRSIPFMMNFSQEIINQSINPEKIDFLFETLIKSVRRKNNLWELQINNEDFIRSQNLILSSSLIVHPRCLEILNINSLPIRDALVKGKDKIVDSLLEITSKQEYIIRKNYIIYSSNKEIVDNLGYKYLQVFFSKLIQSDFNFEKIIFQKQFNGSMIIVLHCSFINKLFELNSDRIIQNLIMIFIKYKKFSDIFLNAKIIDIMDWRASQPINNLAPKELQWSSMSHIGFCGDWFDIEGCMGVETAMNSSIRLAKILD